jgi:Uma2 family endonuclease
MTTTTRRMTFAEYLATVNGSETHYELVDGVLIPMSLGTGKHGKIIRFLTREFERADLQLDLVALELAPPSAPTTAWVALPGLVGVRSPRGTRWDTSRVPDVTVMALAQWEAMSDREAVIDLNEPSPFLVVEVVSESTVSESTKNDDYRSKRSEYALLEIAEYWIVDPLMEQVTLCSLDHCLYDATTYTGEQVIPSRVFPNLNLTAAQVLCIA